MHQSTGDRRIAELDGLRGIAVLLVLFGHAWHGVFPDYRQLIPGAPGNSGGGFFGVHLFFVLSGFLITGILVRQVERTRTVDFRRFYLRRARRLLPALVTVVAVYGLLVTVMTTGANRTAGYGSMVRALLYIEDLPNLIIGDIPSSGWLSHTWSLAVEEQFYLMWPLLLVVVYRRWGRPGLRWVNGAAVLATVIARHVFDALGYGALSDHMLRWDALMVGAFLAVTPLRVPRPVAAAAYLLLLASAFYLPPVNAWVFGMATVVCAAAVASALEQRWLTWRPLVYFGTISYGLYLWHVLLLRFGLPVVPTVLVSIAVAALSWRFIESPFLRQSIRKVSVPSSGEPTGSASLSTMPRSEPSCSTDSLAAAR